MIIPNTYMAALLLTVLTMLCWGSWANTFKLTGKWRFELFYYDYSLGVLIAAIVAAFTFGSMGDSLSFSDNLAIAGKRNMAYGLAAGAVFNLANMLLVAAISISGLAVAFPIGIGLALVVGVIWSYALNPQGSPHLLGAGVAIIVVAILFDALAYKAYARQKAGATSTGKRKPSSKRAWKGIILSLVSGALMGSFYPLVEMGKGGGIENSGLGPYSIAFLFAIGVFLTTFIFNLYFLNLPVEGESISMLAYFQGKLKQHLWGIFGGIVWCAGTIANFAAASAPKEVQVGPAISYGMGQGAALVSALWGLLVWREFAGGGSKVKLYLALMIGFFVLGLVLLSLAPLYAT